jgi:hypothetical protein
MPGGIGPIGPDVLSACARNRRRVPAVANSNEIYYHLDSRRVYYDHTDTYLYFIDDGDNRIATTIRAVHPDRGSGSQIEQMHLDRHRFFAGACRIRLTTEEVRPVLIALRLAGVQATIA